MELYQKSFDVNERLLTRRIGHFISACSQAWRAFVIIPFDSLCPFIGSFSYRFRGNRCFNWTFFFKCPECRVSGTTRKLRRNEFVPKLSSKQSVEYLTHVTLQWTPDDTKITPDSNSLVVNTRQAIVIYWCQNFRSQNKVVYYSWKINEFMLSINC